MRELWGQDGWVLIACCIFVKFCAQGVLRNVFSNTYTLSLKIRFCRCTTEALVNNKTRLSGTSKLFEKLKLEPDTPGISITPGYEAPPFWFSELDKWRVTSSRDACSLSFRLVLAAGSRRFGLNLCATRLSKRTCFCWKMILLR